MDASTLLRPALALLVATALLSGCADKDRRPAGPRAGEQPTVSPTATTATTAPAETPSPSPTTPSSTPPASPTAAAGLAALLPSGPQLPGLNAQDRWKVVSTGPAPSEPFGLCAKVDMASIGAEDAVVRDYAPAKPVAGDRSYAHAMAVAVPDGKTGAQVEAVLRAWQRDCRARLHAQAPRRTWRVDAPVSVSTAAGPGAWYLVMGVRPGAQQGTFTAFGWVRRDTRLVLVEMVSTGQDYDYAPGHEPVARALQVAGRLLTSGA